MATIAAILASVATLVVAVAALYLLVRIGQVVDTLSDHLKKPKG